MRCKLNRAFVVGDRLTWSLRGESAMTGLQQVRHGRNRVTGLKIVVREQAWLRAIRFESCGYCAMESTSLAREEVVVYHVSGQRVAKGIRRGRLVGFNDYLVLKELPDLTLQAKIVDRSHRPEDVKSERLPDHRGYGQRGPRVFGEPFDSAKNAFPNARWNS
jgi:hypothetical protein